ncbi:MAG: GNAT family N-acetyltransferase [Spirochaetales bacterium]|nr:GNAT family N-acetyltransferase [Spirochaetales bacterium]
MSWMRARLDDFNDLRQFLVKHEVSSVGFSAWLKEKIVSTPHIRNDFTVFIKRSKNHILGATSIKEAVLVTEQGLVFPLIKHRPPARLHDLSELSHFMHGFPIGLNSVIGVTKSVETMVQCIGAGVRAQVDYFLMAIDCFPLSFIPPAPIKGIHIHKADAEDAMRLFELQKSYELEEVYLNPHAFNETACYANLKNTLRKELVLVAERNGTPVGKAGTNARGYNMYQLGGVFTREQDRRKGISFLLMFELLNRIFKEQKKACLFVKKSNLGAIRLYEKLGFTMIDNFSIIYLRQNHQ